MAEIDDYIEVLFYLQLPNFKPSDRYIRREEITSSLKQIILAALKEYGPAISANADILAETYFDKLLAHAAFVEMRDPFAGSYYQYIPPKASGLREDFLRDSQIYGMSRAVGPSFFADVFSGYVGTSEIDFPSQIDGIAVPASDRIVTLGHNQIDEIDKPLEQLVSALEADNGIPDRPGLKERLLGQVKAGRELIRAGSFKAYLVYVTLVSGLFALADKYKDHVIGAAAQSLIDLLIKHIFQVPA